MKKLLLSLVMALEVSAQPLLPGRVLKVNDGDTVRLETARGVLRVRLDSIDAPEKKQAFGSRSRQALRELLPVGSPVKLLELGQDRYQRTLGQIYLTDGTNVNALQVRNGQAWVFTRYCRDPAYWMPLQREAQEHRRGLWIEAGAVPPWEFRHPP